MNFSVLRVASLTFCLFFPTFAAAEDPASAPGLTPQASLAKHLDRVGREAESLRRQVAHPHGRPGAAAELARLAAHLERLQKATAELGPEAGAALERQRAALLDRLAHGERRRDPPADPVAGQGGIFGVVTGPDGLPLASAEVIAYRVGGGYAGYDYTDSSGLYQMSLADGSYFVATDLYLYDSPYLNETYDDVLCEGYGPCHTGNATPVVVTGGAMVGQIDFQLSAGGKLRGRVFDQDGLPAPGVQISAYDSQGQPAASTVTDAVGRYTLDRLYPRAYYLRTSSDRHLDELYPNIPCEGGSCPLTSGTATTAVLDGQVTGLDFHLQRLATLSGQVVDAFTEQPISYADVRIESAGGANGRWVSADYLGHWESADLPGGTYFARAEDNDYQTELYDGIACPGGTCSLAGGTPIQLAEGGSVAGIDFSLVPLGTISGSVKAADTLELLSSDVDLFDSEGYYVGYSWSSNFIFEGLEPGSYFVRTDLYFESEYGDELWQDIPCATGCEVTSGTPIAVALGQDVTGIHFLLEKLGSIEGRVLASGGGTPLASAHVSAYSVAAATWVRSAYTDQNGYYRIPGLAAGDHRVTVSSSDYRAEIWNGVPCGPSCDPALGQNIAVTLGQTTAGIDFSLERYGYLAGTVLDQATLAPLSNQRIEVYGSNGGYFGSYYTGTDGSYRTGGLADGTYFAMVYNYSDEDYFSEIYSGIDCQICPSANTGTAIAVSIGNPRTDIDFTVVRSGRIEGAVAAAADGSPAAGGSVAAYDSSGNQVRSAQIGSNGRYNLVGLAAGSYYLIARPYAAELANEIWPGIVCEPENNCNSLLGNPLAVTVGGPPVTANFALDTLGRIEGRLVDAETGAAVGGGSVYVYAVSTGSYVASTAVAGIGNYRLVGLAPGSYKLFTTNHPSHIERVLGGATCENSGCDLSTGTPLTVAMGQATLAPDLPMAFGPGLAGWLRREGSAAAAVGVDVWSSTGDHVSTVATGPGGRFRLSLPSGAYYLTTDVGPGYFDEVYDDIRCEAGPAYLGLCDPTDGQALAVPSGQPAVDGLLFDLESRTAIFRDGFESADFAAWSQVVGNP